MTCPHCGAENPVHAKLCLECTEFLAAPASNGKSKSKKQSTASNGKSKSKKQSAALRSSGRELELSDPWATGSSDSATPRRRASDSLPDDPDAHFESWASLPMDQRRRASDVPSGNFNNYTPRVIAENTVLSRVRRNGRAGRPRKAKTPGTKLVSVSRGLIIVVLLVAAIGTVYVLKPEYIDIAVEYIDNLIHPKPFVAADYDNTILHWHLENSEDEYIDRKLVMYGTVKEVTHIGTRHPRYLIAVNDDDSTLIWANTTSKSGDNSSTFGEGDRIWIYGTFKGNESYQTIMNSAVKHPTITVDKIESHA